MSRALKLGIVAGLVALALPVVGRLGLQLHAPTREAWTVWSVGIDTSVFLARLGRANTGFLDEQLTTRLVYVEQRGRVVEHRAQYGAADLGPDGIGAGPDALREQGGKWKLRVGGTEVQASAELRGFVDGCPPRPGALDGALGLTPEAALSPNGSMVSEGGATLRGLAVVTRSRAVGDVAGNALYVLAPGFALGVDPLSACAAWVRIDDLTWSGEAAPITGPDGTFRVGSWLVRLKPAGPVVTLDAGAHLHPLERALAGLVGYHPARQELRRVSATLEGPGVSGPRTGIFLARLAGR